MRTTETFMRLKSSIDSTIERVPADAAAAPALASAYHAFREEVKYLAADLDLVAEYERLFPDQRDRRIPSVNSLFEAARCSNEFLSLLARLSGWLDGQTRAIQMGEEAAAYAKSRSSLEKCD